MKRGKPSDRRALGRNRQAADRWDRRREKAEDQRMQPTKADLAGKTCGDPNCDTCRTQKAGNL